MVGAEIQRVEIGAGRCSRRRISAWQICDEPRIDQALRDARLIGDHDQRVAGALEQPQRIGRPRKQLEVLEAVEVTDVDVERAVAIEKDGSFHVSLKPSSPQALNRLEHCPRG